MCFANTVHSHNLDGNFRRLALRRQGHCGTGTEVVRGEYRRFEFGFNARYPMCPRILGKSGHRA